VAKAFPVRWLPLVAYRQLGWAWHAVRDRRLAWQVRGALAALPMLPGALRARRVLARTAVVPVHVVVEPRPIRGRRAGDHPAARA
jgi:hypothetical protein